MKYLLFVSKEESVTVSKWTRSFDQIQEAKEFVHQNYRNWYAEIWSFDGQELKFVSKVISWSTPHA